MPCDVAFPNGCFSACSGTAMWPRRGCYAKLGDDALIYALRSREASPNGDVLSPACPPGVIPKINLNNIKGLMVEAAGIEPASEQPLTREPACVDRE